MKTKSYLSKILLIPGILSTVTIHSQIIIPLHSGTDKNLNDVRFLDKNTGYAVGNNATILKTENGGETWISKSNDLPNELISTFFFNTDTGFIGDGEQSIYKTTDGCESFQKVYDGNNPGAVQKFYFTNADTGYAVNIKRVLRTFNGGNSWETTGTTTNLHLMSVYFINDSTGFICGADISDELETYPFIMKTSNFGNSWKKVYDATHHIVVYDFDFLTDTTGFASCDGGIILKTTDAGETWVPQNSETKRELYSISFASADTGFAVGLYGRFVRTTDGGKNWYIISVCTINHLNSLMFVDNTLGYAVGSGGTIYKILTNVNSEYDRNFVTENKTWGVVTSNFGLDNDPSMSSEFFRITGDSVIDLPGDAVVNIYTYHKVKSNCRCFSDGNASFNYLEYLIREESGKIYRFNPLKIADTLLYDFTLGVGDSVYVAEMGGAPAYAFVSQIDSVDFGGVKRKQWTFDNVTDIWIEGVGSIYDPFNPFSHELQIDATKNLLCLADSVDLVYLNPLYSNACEYSCPSSGINEDISGNEISICPNPVNNLLTFEIYKNAANDFSILEIIDISGRPVYRTEYNRDVKNLDVSGICQGYYFLFLRGRNNSAVLPFIIKR